MSEKPTAARRLQLPKDKSLLATIVSLVVGLGLGTTVGRSLLDSAGIPESCVRTITRAERAIDTGSAVAADGRAAWRAVRDLRVGEAATLLRDVRENASLLVDQTKKFDTARKRCDADRE